MDDDHDLIVMTTMMNLLGLFIMRYVAAYLLAVLGGNENPSADDIKKILGSVGIEADTACLKKVISELSGKNIDDLIAEGRQKMSAMPAGGAVFSGASVVSTSSATAAGTEAATEEKKAEAKKEESEPESDEDMGFGLFD